MPPEYSIREQQEKKWGACGAVQKLKRIHKIEAAKTLVLGASENTTQKRMS
jgi:hypothetical protein